MKKILTFSLMILLYANLANAYTFTRSLNIGDVGEDVRQLQIFLNNYSNQTQVSNFGVGSKGNETNYFGNLTKQAVKSFQDLNFEQILKPVNLSSGTGYFGPSTISFVNSIQNNQTNTTSQPQTQAPTQNNLLQNKPVIFSISPENGSSGDEIIIKGSGFDLKDNTIIVTYEERDRFVNIKSNAFGTEIEFKLESSIQERFDEQTKDFSDKTRKQVLERMVEFPIAISVLNKNGQTKPKIFNLKVK